MAIASSLSTYEIGNMIHHLGVFASDFVASRLFFQSALDPLEIIVGYEAENVCEFWHSEADTPSLSLHPVTAEPTRGLHLAFQAEDRASVEAFFAAAIANGGTERNSPRYWPEYHAYCAFVSDTDGNNIDRNLINFRGGDIEAIQ